MKTLTPETAETKAEIAALIYAHKTQDFREFMSFVEMMLGKYARENGVILTED